MEAVVLQKTKMCPGIPSQPQTLPLDSFGRGHFHDLADNFVKTAVTHFKKILSSVGATSEPPNGPSSPALSDSQS